jgi:hypothetical protein
MRKFLLLAVVLFGAVSAFAGPVNFEFLAYTDGNWQLGYPYYITAGPSGSVMAVMCDDYLHGGAPGDTWEANITDLGSNNVSLTRFGETEHALGIGMYREAGWILLETVTTPSSQWMDMNEAVWHIFDPQSPIDSGGEAWLTAAMQEARLGFPGVDFNKVYIITPVNQFDQDPNSMQEFMYIGNDPSSSSGSAATTPEPGTFLLLGTGALAMLRRRFLS